ncbi:MAG: hypothetical protein ACRDPF_04730 [Streptosporangiaceae bacterium]
MALTKKPLVKKPLVKNPLFAPRIIGVARKAEPPGGRRSSDRPTAL